MKKIIAVMVMVMVLAAGLCFGQQVDNTQRDNTQRITVAIAPFEEKSGITKSDADAVTELFTTVLQESNSVRIVTRVNLDNIMSEMQFQMGDWSNDEKTAKLGEAANADWVIRGQITKLGSRIIVTSQGLDVKTLEMTSSARMQMNDIEDAYDQMGPFVNGMVQTMTRDSGGQVVSPGAAASRAANDAAALLERGISFADRQDWDIAIADFSDALNLDPNLAAAYNGRGNAYRRKGDNDSAIADLNQAIRLNPDYALAYRNRALVYESKKDYDREIADCTLAIRFDPNDAIAYRARGYAYLQKSDYDRVIADYTQAIRLDPNNAGSYRNRARAYENKKDYDRAIADYTQAIKLDPNNAWAYRARGYAYRQKGDNDRAIEDYTQSIRLNPNDAEVYNNRGFVYHNKKDYGRAIADYTQAIRLNPNYTTAKQNLEIAQKARGDFLKIGDLGPGGGIVFFAEGGKHMEVSGILGEQTWSNALTTARNYRGGGYSDWRLPTKEELNLIYQNLRAKNIGNLGDSWHLSSSEHLDSFMRAQSFSSGRQVPMPKTVTYSVRAIRAF